MSVQHKSLKHELLYLLGRATAPLNGNELYEKSDLAVEPVQVSKALANLQSDGKIVRVEGDGRARYRLADGVPAPAPAGKAGRSKAVQADDSAAAQSAPLAGLRPAVEPELPVLDIPGPGDHLASLGGAAGKTVRRPAPAAAGAGKLIQVVDVDASATRLADAMLAKSHQQLRRPAEPAPLRWWIDQDGGVELAYTDAGDTITLSAHQAVRLAAMVMAVHDELGQP